VPFLRAGHNTKEGLQMANRLKTWMARTEEQSVPRSGKKRRERF